MPSITPMMSAICRELSLISPIVPITRLTTSLPRVAISDALCARRARLTRVVGVLLDGRGELLHARRRFLQRGRLLLGALREIGVARGDLVGRRSDRFRRVADLADGSLQAVLHIVHGGHHAGLVLRMNVDDLR